MAIDLSKAKKSKRHAGVYLLEDGRLLARALIRSPNGKVRALLRILPVGASEADAVAQVDEMKANAKNPTPDTTLLPPPRDTNQTVEQYIVPWLQLRSQRLSPSTAATYAANINDFILPRLGWLACKDVVRQTIEAWVVWAQALRQPAKRKVVRNGKVTLYPNPNAGKPYAQDTMRQWWRTLCGIMGDMALDKTIADPTRRVRMPERPEQPLIREQRTLEPDASADLLTILRSRFPQHFASIAVMGMLGMRGGEVFALKWDCIDFERGTVMVRRAISKNTLRELTKTKVRRELPLHPVLAKILQEHRVALIEKQHIGLGTNLLFPSDEGKLRTLSSIKKVWPVLRTALGTDVKIGNQVLRRTLNTQLIDAGVDRTTLRAILGHTSEAMTERYAGKGMAKKAEAVDRVRPKPKLVKPEPEE